MSSPIIPAGSPAWVGAADHTIYGGNVDKTNFHSQGVTNPLTDIGAEGFTRMTADLAAVVRTAAFAVMTVTCNDTVAGPPTISFVNQMTGVRLVSYVGNAAPPGFPSGSRNGNGDVTLLWATSYTDPYGVAGAVNFRYPVAAAQGTTPFVPVAQRLDPNADGLYESIRVRCFAFPAGTGQLDAAFTLEAK